MITTVSDVRMAALFAAFTVATVLLLLALAVTDLVIRKIRRKRRIRQKAMNILHWSYDVPEDSHAAAQRGA